METQGIDSKFPALWSFQLHGGDFNIYVSDWNFSRSFFQVLFDIIESYVFYASSIRENYVI